MRTPTEQLWGILSEALISVSSIGDSFEHGTTASWLHDFEFCERALELASLVEVAANAARGGHFRAALAIARTAMEHQAIDSLLLLGATNEATEHDVDDETFLEW